jgi:hypothetical protein
MSFEDSSDNSYCGMDCKECNYNRTCNKDKTTFKSIFSGTLNTKVKYHCSRCGTVGIDIFFDNFLHNEGILNRDAKPICDQCYCEMSRTQSRSQRRQLG